MPRTQRKIPIPAAQQFAYDFFILPGPTLQIIDFAGLPDAGSNQVEVSYAIDVVLNGTTPIFSSSATFMGGRRSRVLRETGTSLGATPSPGSGLGYTFGGFADTLALGRFAAGEGFAVETVTQVIVATRASKPGDWPSSAIRSTSNGHQEESARSSRCQSPAPQRSPRGCGPLYGRAAATRCAEVRTRWHR